MWLNSLLYYLRSRRVPSYGEQRGEDVVRGSVRPKVVGVALNDFFKRDKDMVALVQQLHSQNQIAEFDWHMEHPVVGGTKKKNMAPEFADVATYLPLCEPLVDKLINEVFLPLKALGINVLFRPLHECNGSWFWWGQGGLNSGDNVKAAHQWMFSKLEAAGCTNVLYVFNVNYLPNRTAKTAAECYPGNAFCHYVTFDIYKLDAPELLISIADEWNAFVASTGKPTALSEFGATIGGSTLEKVPPVSPDFPTFYSRCYEAFRYYNFSYARSWGGSYVPRLGVHPDIDAMYYDMINVISLLGTVDAETFLDKRGTFINLTRP